MKTDKKSIKKLNRTVFALSFSVFMSLASFAYSQGIDDLGLVWSKTYGTGTIRNIKSNPNDAGYIACGEPWNTDTPAGMQRLYGLVIEFDESGNELRRATALIPQTYIGGHNDFTRAGARFHAAFKTDDGGILAFGYLYDYNANANEKEPNWDGQGGTSKFLTNGAWIVKFNPDLSIAYNTLAQGVWFLDGWRTSDGGYVIGGFDKTDNGGGNGSITMLRKYNQNGGLLIDGRANYREINAIYKFPATDEFVAATYDHFLRIDQNIDIASPVYVRDLDPLIIWPRNNSISPSIDGGVFIQIALEASADVPTDYNNGYGTYKINSSDAVAYYKVNDPADTTFTAPLLLPGGDNPPKYIGTATLRNNAGLITDNKIYELTDNGAFTYRVGDSYPDGTALKAVSQSDGFFSCGSSSAGLAAIAKLSTCANFILDVGSTVETLLLSQSGEATFSGRTLGNAFYTGNKGTVTYSWTLTDVTPGGAAVADLGITSGNQTVNPDIPAKTFTLLPDKTGAVLQYSISAIDTYENNGVQQTCQQTRTVMVKIMNYPDNVSDADCYIDPQATDWNFNTTPDNIGSLLMNYSPVFAGDLDGDNLPELVSVGNDNGTTGTDTWTGESVYVYMGSDRSDVREINLPGGVRVATVGGAIALGRIKTDGGTDKSLIFITGTDEYLYAYSLDNTSTPYWKSTDKFSNSHPYYPQSGKPGKSGTGAQTLGITDFNGDGYSELYINNSIFDAATGKRLCRGTGNEGFSNAHTGNLMSLTAVGDFDNDGRQELAAGNTVWKVNISRTDNLTMSGSMSEYAKMSLASTPYAGATDGHTQVVDLDMDGKLDVVVSRVMGTTSALYVWNPADKKIIAGATFTSGASSNMGSWFEGYGKSVPFIGDVDNDPDKRPEILVLADNIRAYKYNGTTTLSLFWTLASSDPSRGTGMTLFDFNQDGKNEIVYRDQDLLRIIDGSTSSPKVESFIAAQSLTVRPFRCFQVFL